MAAAAGESVARERNRGAERARKGRSSPWKPVVWSGWPERGERRRIGLGGGRPVREVSRTGATKQTSPARFFRWGGRRGCGGPRSALQIVRGGPRRRRRARQRGGGGGARGREEMATSIQKNGRKGGGEEERCKWAPSVWSWTSKGAGGATTACAAWRQRPCQHGGGERRRNFPGKPPATFNLIAKRSPSRF